MENVDCRRAYGERIGKQKIQIVKHFYIIIIKPTNILCGYTDK